MLMNAEFQPQAPIIDPIEAELQNMLGNVQEGVHPEAVPEGLTLLTEAEIDAMFSSISEDDLALLGVADVATVTARSLTGNLTVAEQAEVEEADARAVEAAHRFFAGGAAAAAQEQASIADTLSSFGRREDDREDELVGAGRR
jgi:hypothetical protein